MGSRRWVVLAQLCHPCPAAHLVDRPAKGGEAPGKSSAKPAEDIADLKEEMEAMRKQLAELSQRK